MFGIKIDSWEKLVSEFAGDLDASNMEARPFVDLTEQCTGVYVDLSCATTALISRTVRSSARSQKYHRVRVRDGRGSRR